MPDQSYGKVLIINLPGVGSLLSRTWDTYKALFGKLVSLTALFAIGLAINLSLNTFLDYLSVGKSDSVNAVIQILMTLVNLGCFLYYSYILAGIIYLAHAARKGNLLSVSQSLELASQRYRSLFWVLILFALVTYGSLITFVLAVLFYVWFYFGIYVVLLDEERGVSALAKSRYLTHGIFFKTLGRYLAISVIGIALLYISYLFLTVQVIGGIFFLALALAIAFFGFPFFIIYEYFRYEDVCRLERNAPFTFFGGDKAGILAWGIFGLVLVMWGWTYGILGASGRSWVTENLTKPVARAIVPLTIEARKNLDRISPILEKFESPSSRATSKEKIESVEK
jgi:hypothetical protein